jgi:predicted RNase H-like nuclease (RuvC/YqgF family)
MLSSLLLIAVCDISIFVVV